MGAMMEQQKTLKVAQLLVSSPLHSLSLFLYFPLYCHALGQLSNSHVDKIPCYKLEPTMREGVFSSDACPSVAGIFPSDVSLVPKVLGSMFFTLSNSLSLCSKPSKGLPWGHQENP